MFSPILIISLALLSSSIGHARKFHGYSLGKQVQKQIDDGIGKFGVDLHKHIMNHLTGTGENILVSPISLYFSLALAHLGTAGQTRDELKTVMGLPNDEHLSHQILGELYKHMQHCIYSNVSIHNGVFLQTGITFKNTYLDKIKTYYQAYLTNVDFTHDDAINTINKWFIMETGGKIMNFYDHPISEDVKLVFANALTFNGIWDRQFSPELTKTETFMNDDGHEEQVSMMHKRDFLPYYNIPEYKSEIVGIPMKNGEHYMYIVLPNEGVNLVDVVGQINYEGIQQIISHSVRQTVDIKIPQLMMKSHEQMKDMLQMMGVHKLFDSPDLSNMLTHMNLKVTQIWHSTEMKMDEHGIDAWAGTTQEYQIYDEFIPNDDVKQYYIHKPFMFFIYHPSTKSVLYYGCVHKINSVN